MEEVGGILWPCNKFLTLAVKGKGGAYHIKVINGLVRLNNWMQCEY